MDKGRISRLPLDKGNKLKEESWEVYQGWIWCVFFGSARKRRRGRSVRKKTLVFMCEGKLFIEKMCANKNMEEGCV